jgi:hypothetical protein
MSAVKTSYWGYLPILGSGEVYKDDGSQVLISFPVHIRDNRSVEVALIGTPTEIKLIRVHIEGVEEVPGSLTQKEEEVIGQIYDHMLAILSITYDQNAKPIYLDDGRIAMAVYSEKPSLDVICSHGISDGWQIDSKNIASTFCSSWKSRPMIRLLADSQNQALPVYYRYLSAYKALELSFRKSRKWSHDLDKLLSGFEDEFEGLNISKRKLKAFVHETRDRCAHIELGSGRVGVSGLSSSEAQKIIKFLPMFRRILKAHLNESLASSGLSFV